MRIDWTLRKCFRIVPLLLSITTSKAHPEAEDKKTVLVLNGYRSVVNQWCVWQSTSTPSNPSASPTVIRRPAFTNQEGRQDAHDVVADLFTLYRVQWSPRGFGFIPNWHPALVPPLGPDVFRY